MNKPLWFVAVAPLAVLALGDISLAQVSREAATVDTATRVLRENVAVPMSGIPQALLNNAQAIAIVPDVVKVGFVLAGRRGHGVIVVRNPDGSWSNPVFITLTGGSVGWQVGVQSTDVILVFKSQKSARHVLDGQFTLGADAAVAAGPLGRQAAAATDVELRAEIYSYSRSRGLFAGVSLDGSVMEVDSNANAAFYGAMGIGPYDILGGKTVQTPADVVALRELLMRHAPPPQSLVQALGGQSPYAGPPAASAVETTRQQLAAAWQQLGGQLDAQWRDYLALPPAVFAAEATPREADVREALQRFDTAAKDPRYVTLAQMPQFQAAHAALRNYLGALAASVTQTSRRSTLPPPPTAGAPRNY